MTMTEHITQKQPESVASDLGYGINGNFDPSAITNWGDGLGNGREILTQDDVPTDKNPEGLLTQEMGADIFAARKAQQLEYESQHQPNKVVKLFSAAVKRVVSMTTGKNTDNN